MIRTSHHSLILRSCVLAALFVPALAARPVEADTVRSGGTVTVTPGGRVTQTGYRTAVVAATATNGDTSIAQSAMLAANVALGRVPGFIAIPAKEVGGAFGSLQLRDTLDAQDYKAIGKKLKAPRVLSVTVSPGDVGADSTAYAAVAELYDTATGGLVGRGQATYTATADAVAADTTAQKADGKAAMADVLPNRALSGAVYQAINDLNRPATFSGVVISVPGPYQARLSLGERNGLRNGARVEYLSNGLPIAYGTVIDLGAGESVATVAPESNVNAIGMNTPFRTISNPMASRAGKTIEQIEDAEFKSFERDFGLSAIIAGIAYYAFK